MWVFGKGSIEVESGGVRSPLRYFWTRRWQMWVFGKGSPRHCLRWPELTANMRDHMDAA